MRWRARSFATATLPHARAPKTGHDTRHNLELAAGRLRDHHVDLLVIGAYGHSRIRQFIVGSTTTACVRTCLVPVLMFR
ncbi:hypothetical protein ASA1KI_35460 [Opitutales bacterium ASA1]|nr:hypothetical protein ASA1KI_35460 [Opitutales bacterium ASA1]